MTSYTNLSLYYLNQMGITPWVTRSKKKDTTQLAVVVPPSQSPKAQSLLKNMLDFLGLSPEEVCIIQDKKSEDLKALDTSSLSALLLLGFGAQEYAFSCPLFLGANPEVLIKNPLHKKELFKALHTLKNHLSQHGH